jgi:hypothetical protein
LQFQGLATPSCQTFLPRRQVQTAPASSFWQGAQARLIHFCTRLLVEGGGQVNGSALRRLATAGGGRGGAEAVAGTQSLALRWLPLRATFARDSRVLLNPPAVDRAGRATSDAARSDG